MSENTNLVFVYGSLKMGFGNHCLLVKANATPVASGMTLDSNFSMESLAGGSFPAVYRGGDESIWGEVYEVDDAGLAHCDRLEGHPRFYRREQVDIMTEDGKRVTAWMYLLSRDTRLQLRHPPKFRVEVKNIEGFKIANWLPRSELLGNSRQ